MTAEDELLLTNREPNRAWRFDLVLPLFIRPRSTLARIAGHNRPLWRTPILLLSLAAIGRALVAGSINAAARAAGEVTLPPGFEYYTPEQQAQFQQAATATNNPTFNYVLPALGALAGVFILWLVIGWLLHLVLTLLGGRGSSQATLNIAAWASLPLLLRYLVQIGFMLVNDQLVAAPGISGFAPVGEGWFNIALASALSQIDIYWLWQVILLIIGARLVSQLTTIKSTIAVLLVMFVVMFLRALPAVILARFSDITVIRPFF